MALRDGDWVLFDYDFRTGRSVWKFSHGDGRVTFRTDYPVTELLDTNQRALNASTGARWGDGKVAAKVPKNIYWDKLHEPMEQDDDKYVSRFLNDSDNGKFRTFGGRV